MGANLIADGATFRVWAPNARSVHVLGDFNTPAQRRQPAHARRARPLARLHSRAYATAHRYMFYVVGDGSEGPKRDPYARELQTPFPSDCIIRDDRFPLARDAASSPRSFTTS